MSLPSGNLPRLECWIKAVAHGEEGEEKHSFRVMGKSEPRRDSWEGKLKEVLGRVVNHASLRQVKEKKVVFIRMNVQCQRHLSSVAFQSLYLPTFLPYCSCIVIINPHFRHGQWKSDSYTFQAKGIWRESRKGLFYPEALCTWTTPSTLACERVLSANLAFVIDLLPLHMPALALIGYREVGGAGPVLLTTHTLPEMFSLSFHLPQNLKKSWHPQTLRNVEKVWKAEQKHEAERKKIEELQRELREERAREEMQRYAEDVGAVK